MKLARILLLAGAFFPAAVEGSDRVNEYVVASRHAAGSFISNPKLYIVEVKSRILLALSGSSMNNEDSPNTSYFEHIVTLMRCFISPSSFPDRRWCKAMRSGSSSKYHMVCL